MVPSRFLKSNKIVFKTYYGAKFYLGLDVSDKGVGEGARKVLGLFFHGKNFWDEFFEIPIPKFINFFISNLEAQTISKHHCQGKEKLRFIILTRALQICIQKDTLA